MAGSVSRRDFFKAGGMAGLAAGVAGLGIGSILGVPEEAVAETITVTDFVYTCPVCGAKALDYEALVKHFEEEHPDSTSGIPQCATLNINGAELKVQVEPQWTLRETLLKAVGLSGGAKEMCDRGGCGSCTVLIDGVPGARLHDAGRQCEGKQIETSEGIAADERFRPLVESYAKYDTAQCGYCTPASSPWPSTSSRSTASPLRNRSARSWPATSAVAAPTAATCRPSRRPPVP